MLISAPDAAYLMTIYEILGNESSGATTIGLCFLDAATSRFIIGQVILPMMMLQLVFFCNDSSTVAL
jgi:hypothetical protein